MKSTIESREYVFHIQINGISASKDADILEHGVGAWLDSLPLETVKQYHAALAWQSSEDYEGYSDDSLASEIYQTIDRIIDAVFYDWHRTDDVIVSLTSKVD